MQDSKIIFLVDDDMDDIDFFKEALAEIDPTIKCITALNGEIALKKLMEWNAPYPDFIFLDMNLPRFDGRKCLIEIKKIKAIRQVPVIMYSTSSEQKIMDDTIAMGAALFLTKPNTQGELCKAIRYIFTADLKRFLVS